MMRPFWIVAFIVCGVLALASVASASMRDEAHSSIASVTAPTSGDDAVSPIIESETPSPAPSETINHGAAVSLMAKDKEAVATKTLPNGKTITNHGMAVSAVARSEAGRPPQAGNSGDH